MGIFDFFKKIIKNYNDEQNAEIELNKKIQKLQSKELNDFYEKIDEVFSNIKGIDLFEVLPIPDHIDKKITYNNGVLSFLFDLEEGGYNQTNYWYFNDNTNHYLIRKPPRRGGFLFQFQIIAGKRNLGNKLEENRYDYVKINKLDPPADDPNAILEEIILGSSSEIFNLARLGLPNVLKGDLKKKKERYSNVRFSGRGFTADYFKGYVIITKKIKKPKNSDRKSTSKSLSDDQKYFLDAVKKRVRAMGELKDFDVEDLAYAHCDEYINIAERIPIPKNKRNDVALDRILGFTSIQEYISKNATKVEKFHFEASLQGAMLYAKHLNISQNIIKKYLSSKGY